MDTTSNIISFIGLYVSLYSQYCWWVTRMSCLSYQVTDVDTLIQLRITSTLVRLWFATFILSENMYYAVCIALWLSLAFIIPRAEFETILPWRWSEIEWRVQMVHIQTKGIGWTSSKCSRICPLKSEMNTSDVALLYKHQLHTHA